VGLFGVEHAVTPDELDGTAELPPGSFLSITEAVREIDGITILAVTDREVSLLRNGGRIDRELTERAVAADPGANASHLLCVDDRDSPVALLQRDAITLSYAAVFPAEGEDGR
jgi:hypothetical protein